MFCVKLKKKKKNHILLCILYLDKTYSNAFIDENRWMNSWSMRDPQIKQKIKIKQTHFPTKRKSYLLRFTEINKN